LVKKYPNSTPKLDGGGHVEHHSETLDDMSLRQDEKWKKTAASKKLDEDEWRGVAFSWPVTGIMTAQMAPQVYPWFMLALNWNFAQTTAFFLPSMILHALIWNALHPKMHGLPDVPASVGAPSWVFIKFLDTPYFRYLYDNHAGHHVGRGQINYNVACPLFDHILGTYQSVEEWTAKYSKQPAAEAV